MSTHMRAVLRETARDFAIVAAFCFWAAMIGFLPAVAMRALIA